MSKKESIKDEILDKFRELWFSPEFELKDTARNNALRPDLIKKLAALLMTDDERASFYGLPEGCRIREGAKIISPENFRCGKHVWIGENVILDASGGLEIGDHTSISSNSCVWSHTSSLSNLALSNQPGNPYIKRKKTIIGSGCFISGTVYPGITIGDKCILTPQSVAIKDLPSYCIAGGNPASILKRIDQSYIDEKINELRFTK